jgi:hypothetical protein
LTKSCPNNAIVGNLWVETIINEALALDAVDFDVQGGAIGVWAQGDWVMDRSACTAAQVFNSAQCSASRATDIIWSAFETIEFLYHCERYDDVAVRK